MELVCLANSMRPDGRCIAGIDRVSRQWVRPIPRDGDAIPEARCFAGDRFLSLLDVFEVDVTRPRETPRYQCENYLLNDWNWKFVRRARKDRVERLADDSAPILHNDSDRVAPACLDRLAPDGWKSLQLVRSDNVLFEPEEQTPHRWRARFRDRLRNEYFLKVTDPEITRRLENGALISPACLLTVSLTRPWQPGGAILPWCYKIVAAVIEL